MKQSEEFVHQGACAEQHADSTADMDRNTSMQGHESAAGRRSRRSLKGTLRTLMPLGLTLERRSLSLTAAQQTQMCLRLKRLRPSPDLSRSRRGPSLAGPQLARLPR